MVTEVVIVVIIIIVVVVVVRLLATWTVLINRSNR